MAYQVGIPKGTRDFTPNEVSRREYILETIKKHFIRFGFQPIETPSFENYNTLMGKYGEEGDRLIFKILNSGDYLSKVEDQVYTQKNSSKLTPKIADKALRYDLTVPFARYVVMHQNEINFPFKRYQMQNVWRADRPQKGRFREFFQCDADVVGTASLLQEVEFIQLYDAVFSDLSIQGTTINMNNRKVLSGIAEVIGAKASLIDFTVALDKLDKIGVEKVKQEMLAKGISEDAILKAQPLFGLEGTNEEKLKILSTFLKDSKIGMQGVEEMQYIVNTIAELGLKTSNLQLEVSLARGLNYYTGAIFEVSAPENVSIGSIGGGGRYDNLTGMFGLDKLPGIGISFGLDRIYLVLEELSLFPESVDRSLDLLFLNFGNLEAIAALKIIKDLRVAGLQVDLYPSAVKIQKQFKYANAIKVPFVALLGNQELAANNVVIKDMGKGSQEIFALADIKKLFEYVDGSN